MLSPCAIAPRLEIGLMRDPCLGFEAHGDSGFIRYIEHGVAAPPARWHYHEEYELQLIVETRGLVFVGDYIGDFEPGHLVLTGPGLPHNWISTNAPPAGVDVCRLAIQFHDAPLRRGVDALPGLSGLLSLLERARSGIEFFGVSDLARQYFHRIRQSQSARRFAEFTHLLCDLADCQEYRLLSATPMRGQHDGSSMERLNKVIEYVGEHYPEPIEMRSICPHEDEPEHLLAPLQPCHG